MRRALPSLLSALLLSSLLAGCSDGSGGSSLGEDGEAFDDLVATSETGILRGVVIDEAIQPLAGATVTVNAPESDELTATSADDGSFGFDGLLAGTYFVRAEKEGFLSSEAIVDVAAGVDDPDIVQIRLAVDPEALPYHQEYKFEGFIECSFSLVAFGIALCATAGSSNDRFNQEETLDQVPDWAQSEMVWDSTQDVSDGMSLSYSAPGAGVLLDNYAEARGTSPLLVHVNRTVAEERSLGSGQTLLIRVFNEPIDGTRPPDPIQGDDCLDRPALGGCFTGVGMTLNQEFTIYTHVFYGYTPPEGWRFTEGPVPPPPMP